MTHLSMQLWNYMEYTLAKIQNQNNLYENNHFRWSMDHEVNAFSQITTMMNAQQTSHPCIIHDTT